MLNARVEEINNMITILPEKEQELAYEFIKRMVLAWDPDYTRLTENEKVELEKAEKEFENSEYVNHEDIEW